MYFEVRANYSMSSSSPQRRICTILRLSHAQQSDLTRSGTTRVYTLYRGRNLNKLQQYKEMVISCRSQILNKYNLIIWKWPQSIGSVDRQRALLSVSSLGRLSRSTGGLNGQKYDRWPVDRKGISALSNCQRAEFCGGYKYPPFEFVFNKFYNSKNSHSF